MQLSFLAKSQNALVLKVKKKSIRNSSFGQGETVEVFSRL